MKQSVLLLLGMFTLGTSAQAETDCANCLWVRVIDVGQGHAAIARIPKADSVDNSEFFYFLYDTGPFHKETLKGIDSVMKSEKKIDLIVLSHTDSDHIGGLPGVLDTYTVTKLIRPGFKRDTDVWCEANKKIIKAERGELKDEKNKRRPPTTVIDLSRSNVAPGSRYEVGAAHITIVSGFADPPEDWAGIGEIYSSEYVNAGSIVVRLEYKKQSVLFSGDAVGCEDEKCENPIATEEFMINNAQSIPLRSEVYIAAHHGSWDASSPALIQKVKPEWVIFPAGSHRGFQHPHAKTVERFISAKVDEKQMLRTDRGDDDGEKQWRFNDLIEGCLDKTGDDSIDIVISADEPLSVTYTRPNPPRTESCK